MRAVWSFIIVIGLGLAPQARAQPPHAVYLPLVAAAPASPPPAPASFPDGWVRLPVTCLDSAYPFPIPADAPDTWLITCYRVDAGDLNGAWLLRWDTQQGSVALVRQLAPRDPRMEASLPPLAEGRGIAPVERLCSARVELIYAPDGQRYALCYESDTGRAHAIRSIRLGER